MLKDMNFSMNLGAVVVEGIKNSNYHNKLVDESSDVSNKEQAMFCVSWVDVDLISCRYGREGGTSLYSFWYFYLFELIFLFIY